MAALVLPFIPSTIFCLYFKIIDGINGALVLPFIPSTIFYKYFNLVVLKIVDVINGGPRLTIYNINNFWGHVGGYP